MDNKVLISKEDLQYLKACAFTLHQVTNVNGLCPNCPKAMLVKGLICMNCGYDSSYTIEEWKKLKRNKKL